MSDDAPGDDTVVLRDGRTLRIRPVRADDAARIIAMHEGFSARTVRRRFFSSMPHLPAEQARRFAEVDGTTRVALVAETAAGDLVAVARYDCLPGDGSATSSLGAEFAIVVSDDYQHHGLGVALLRRLIVVARDHGVDHFSADVLMDNRPMLATFRDVGLTFTSQVEGGVVHLELPLPDDDRVTSADPGPATEPPR